MADQTDHFAGLDVQVDAAVDGPVAVAEADFAQVDVALDLFQWHRIGRFRHARHMVEDVENAFCGGGRFLRY